MHSVRYTRKWWSTSKNPAWRNLVKFTPPADADRPPAEGAGRDWGSFLFYVAFLTIALLTLFPYQLLPQETLSNRQGPFWMWFFEKLPYGGDFLANIALFLPFGFALAWRLEGRFRWFSSLLITFLGSLLFTFSIELTQVYMPSRTSSWYDVAANTMGGTIGWLAFRVVGGHVEKILSAILTGFYRFLRPSLLGAFVILYAVAGIVFSIPLNRTSILRNWDASLPLLVGNVPGLSHGWRGSVFEVGIADRYMNAGEAARVFQSGFGSVAGENLIASYTPSAASVVPDAAGKSPSLSWLPSIPPTTGDGANFRPGGPWLETSTPASSLVTAIQATDQFALYVVFDTPQGLQMGVHPIVALGSVLNNSDLVLGQYYSSLFLRMRTPLNPFADRRPEYAVSEFFFQPGRHRVIFTYDGARMNFYADGSRTGAVMELGPGAAAVREFRRPRQFEMHGYKMTYYGLLFIPLGCALALITIKSKRVAWAAVGCGLVLPGLILEPVLFATSHRPFYIVNIVLAVGLTGASFLFVRRFLPR
jgi:glycopeptide antibiotics resistance protein